MFLTSCNTAEKASSKEQSKSSGSEQKQEQEDSQEEEQETSSEEEQKDSSKDEDKEEDVEATYKLNQESWYIEPLNDDTNEKVVLFTIDDAPDEYAVEMAETLKELDVPSIFFVNGHLLESDEGKSNLKAIHEMGFMIGNHTYSHENLPDLNKDKQKEEIVSVNNMVEEVIGEKPLFFRAPFGANTDYTKKIAEEEGMTLMNWSYGYDWNEEYMTKEAITDAMINADELGNGANLLMHDREWTAAGLAEIVDGLREKGYEMVDPALIQTDEKK